MPSTVGSWRVEARRLGAPHVMVGVMVVTVASSGSMGAKCLLMVLMTPHSPHLGTSPAHSVSLSASPTTAHLTSPQLYLDINTAAKQILQL